jgi:hypothetical protein
MGGKLIQGDNTIGEIFFLARRNRNDFLYLGILAERPPITKGRPLGKVQLNFDRLSDFTQIISRKGADLIK